VGHGCGAVGGRCSDEAATEGEAAAAWGGGSDTDGARGCVLWCRVTTGREGATASIAGMRLTSNRSSASSALSRCPLSALKKTISVPI
jgi:hypothetical protein